MSRNRLIYTALAAALLIFSAAYQSRIASVLLTAVLCYPAAAAVCVLICSRLTDVSFSESFPKNNGVRSAPRTIRQKGEVYDLWIYVRCRSIFPCVPIELQCSLPDRDTGLFAAKRIYTSVPPMGSFRLPVSVMHRYRGAYAAQISRAAFFDPLRIIRISRTINSEAALIFLPRRLDLGELIAQAPGEESTEPSLLLKGERDDFSHVREYMQGDIMQLVHWKLTAKLDDIMIKQYDRSSERRAAILCDYNTEAADTGTVMKLADLIIETAIAISLASVKSGVVSRVDFGDIAGEYRSDIRDMSDFERFYDLAAVMPLHIRTMELGQLIASGLPGASVVFLITSRLSEELISQAAAAAENFCGVFVVANAGQGTPPELEEKAREQRFTYLPIKEKAAV